MDKPCLDVNDVKELKISNERYFIKNSKDSLIMTTLTAFDFSVPRISYD